MITAKLTAIGVVAGCSILMAGAIVVLSNRNDALQARLEAQEVELTKATASLNSCSATKDAIRNAHEKCVDEIRLVREDVTYQRSMVEQLSASIRKGSEDVRRERTVIYRQPECQELASLDIAGVCPALAVSVRARAAGMSTP